MICTKRAKRPTCSVAHLPARIVNSIRGGAIRPSVIVHDAIAHAPFGHAMRVLCHTRIVARPKHGRSVNSTARRSLTQPRSPQPTQAWSRPRLSTWTSKRSANKVDHTEHGDVRQAHEKLADANSVSGYRGPFWQLKT